MTCLAWKNSYISFLSPPLTSGYLFRGFSRDQLPGKYDGWTNNLGVEFFVWGIFYLFIFFSKTFYLLLMLFIWGGVFFLFCFLRLSTFCRCSSNMGKALIFLSIYPSEFNSQWGNGKSQWTVWYIHGLDLYHLAVLNFSLSHYYGVMEITLNSPMVTVTRLGHTTHNSLSVLE